MLCVLVWLHKNKKVGSSLVPGALAQLKKKGECVSFTTLMVSYTQTMSWQAENKVFIVYIYIDIHTSVPSSNNSPPCRSSCCLNDSGPICFRRGRCAAIYKRETLSRKPQSRKCATSFESAVLSIKLSEWKRIPDVGNSCFIMYIKEKQVTLGSCVCRVE